MDRIEIVDPGANGEAGFSIESKKWPAVEERVIMLSTAGTEYTLSKPSLCPYYGDHLKSKGIWKSNLIRCLKIPSLSKTCNRLP